MFLPGFRNQWLQGFRSFSNFKGFIFWIFIRWFISIPRKIIHQYDNNDESLISHKKLYKSSETFFFCLLLIVCLWCMAVVDFLIFFILFHFLDFFFFQSFCSIACSSWVNLKGFSMFHEPTPDVNNHVQ